MLSDTPTVPYSVQTDDEPMPRLASPSRVTESRAQQRVAAPPIWPYPSHPKPAPRGTRVSGGSGCATVAGACLTLLVGLLVGVAVGRASASLLPSQDMTNVLVPHIAPLMQPAATATPTATPVPTDTPVPTATPDTSDPNATQPAQAGVALSEDDAAALITQYYDCCGANEGVYVMYQITSLQLTPMDASDVTACAQYEYAAASDPNTPQGSDLRIFNLSSPDGATWQVSGMGSTDSCGLQNG